MEGNIERFVYSPEDSFTFGYDQPALDICKKINQCKSAFN